MLTHPSGLFSGDYNSAQGCWPLKFLHTLFLPKMYFKSDMGAPGGLMSGSAPYF